MLVGLLRAGGGGGARQRLTSQIIDSIIKHSYLISSWTCYQIIGYAAYDITQNYNTQHMITLLRP